VNGEHTTESERDNDIVGGGGVQYIDRGASDYALGCVELVRRAFAIVSECRILQRGISLVRCIKREGERQHTGCARELNRELKVRMLNGEMASSVGW